MMDEELIDELGAEELMCCSIKKYLVLVYKNHIRFIN